MTDTKRPSLSMGTASGRMRGYTDEIDWVERQVAKIVGEIHEEIRVKGKKPLTLTFEVTRRSVIGSRGVFTRRTISQYEYEILGPEAVVKVVAGFLGDLVGRIS